MVRLLALDFDACGIDVCEWAAWYVVPAINYVWFSVEVGSVAGEGYEVPHGSQCRSLQSRFVNEFSVRRARACGNTYAREMHGRAGCGGSG